MYDDDSFIVFCSFRVFFVFVFVFLVFFCISRQEDGLDVDEVATVYTILFVCLVG